MHRRDGRAARAGRQPAAALALAAMLALGHTACKETAPPVLVPAQPTYAEDSAAIIRLEDLRVLRDAADSPRDLTAITKRTDPNLRRRAAFAIGRVGDVAGRPALEALLGDPEPMVRQAAAFGLGLLGDKAAVTALITALNGDASPLVRGRAAEALGLIGDAAAAAPIGAYVTSLIAGGALASVQADELAWPLAPEADACRLGIYALVRLKAPDVLLPAILDAEGRPRSEWWPIAFALRRTEDPRTLAPLQILLKGNGFYGAAFAAQGLGLSKQPAIAVPPLLEVLASATPRPAVRLQAVRGLGRLGDPRAVAPLVALLDEPTLDPALHVEVVTALGALKALPAIDRLLDRLGDRLADHSRRRGHRARGDRRARVPAGAVGRRSGSRLDGARRGRGRAGLARRGRARSGVEAVSRRHRPPHLAGHDEGAGRGEDARGQGDGGAPAAGAPDERGRDRPRHGRRDPRRRQAGRRRGGPDRGVAGVEGGRGHRCQGRHPRGAGGA